MRRRDLLAAGLAPFRTRPSVLFYMPDQLRAQALGYMGNEDARTPNIDRLAETGLVFPNTFANSPVCCPARAVLLTGQYAHRNGMVANDLRLRESEVTLGELFSGAGYRTGFIGKWHLDGGPRMPGFVPPGPRRHGFQFWAANECSHSHFDTQYFRDSPRPVPIRRFEAEAWTDLAIEFLRAGRNDPRPFFLVVQPGPPHDPYKAPPAYSRMHDPHELRMRPNWRPGAGAPDRPEIAEYNAMVSAVDHEFGRLLGALNELGLAPDTVVLFSSDHGDMLGSHGLRLKRKPWEESILVPGIVRYPAKVQPGWRADCLLSHVDFAPTLLGLCGLNAPRAMQGTDLSPLVLGRGQRGPASAYFQIFGPYAGDGTEGGWRGVRTSRYMYARYRSRPWVLYDLERDPYEQNNLAGQGWASSLVKEMEDGLEEWMSRTGDSWEYDWTAPVEDNGRLFRGKTFYTVQEYLAWSKENEKR